jgi:hypothetical protein
VSIFQEDPQVILNDSGEIICEKPHLVQRKVSFKAIVKTLQDHTSGFADWNDRHLEHICGNKVATSRTDRDKQRQTRSFLMPLQEEESDAGSGSYSDSSDGTEDSHTWARVSSPNTRGGTPLR